MQYYYFYSPNLICYEVVNNESSAYETLGYMKPGNDVISSKWAQLNEPSSAKLEPARGTDSPLLDTDKAERNK